MTRPSMVLNRLPSGKLETVYFGDSADEAREVFARIRAKGESTELLGFYRMKPSSVVSPAGEKSINALSVAAQRDPIAENITAGSKAVQEERA